MRGISAYNNPGLTKKVKALMLFSAAVFLVMIVFGVIKKYDSDYSDAQATLILIQGIVGFALLWFPLILLKLFRLRISFAVHLVVTFFMFLAMLLGEAFQFYYRLPWWDSMLHISSGFGIAFVAYCLVNAATRNFDLKNRFAFCLVGAIVISLSVGLLWEVIEYSIDSLFGTNMQKFIPEEFFNGGQTNTDLIGAQEEIAEFFSSPQGYRFALMDTMKDILMCLVGVGAFVVLAAATKKSSVYSTAIVIEPAASRRVVGKPIKNKEPVYNNPVYNNIVEPEEQEDDGIKSNYVA